MKNKKAQEMNISATMLIILGVIILVVLVIGFSLGWDKLLPWLKTNNVETIKTACGVACTTNSVYDFCSAQRNVKDGTNDKFEATCEELATNPTYVLRNYDITPCPNLCPATP